MNEEDEVLETQTALQCEATLEGFQFAHNCIQKRGVGWGGGGCFYLFWSNLRLLLIYNMHFFLQLFFFPLLQHLKRRAKRAEVVLWIC